MTVQSPFAAKILRNNDLLTVVGVAFLTVYAVVRVLFAGFDAYINSAFFIIAPGLFCILVNAVYGKFPPYAPVSAETKWEKWFASKNMGGFDKTQLEVEKSLKKAKTRVPYVMVGAYALYVLFEAMAVFHLQFSAPMDTPKQIMHSLLFGLIAYHYMAFFRGNVIDGRAYKQWMRDEISVVLYFLGVMLLIGTMLSFLVILGDSENRVYGVLLFVVSLGLLVNHFFIRNRK